MSLVSDGLHYEFATEAERVNYGNRLKVAIANFTMDFIPHMNEEEEVNMNVCVCLKCVQTVMTYSI